MSIALVNPNWRLDGGVYFGCRALHELGTSQPMPEKFRDFSGIQKQRALRLRVLVSEVHP